MRFNTLSSLNYSLKNKIQKKIWALRDYANALQFFPPKQHDWITHVHTASSLKGEGFEEIWKNIDSFFNRMNHSGWITENRKRQELAILEEMMRSLLQSDFFSNDQWMEKFHSVEERVKSGNLLAYQAAEELFQEFRAGGR